MSNKPTKRAEPQALQSIDPAQLQHVSGGAARVSSAGSADSDVMTALTGVLDSLKSLNNQQSSGFGPTEMMMFMMLMGGRQQAPVVQTSAPGTVGGYAGYTIDGVYYPFK